MQDRQLYEQILGIGKPWSVERVELKQAAGEVHVHLRHADGVAWSCPDCAKTGPLHDHQPERVWRHLDTCQFQTLLHAAPPRMTCPEHGVKTVRLPWAEPHSRFTLLFERLAIGWLKEASQQAVADQMGLSWDQIHGIMERAVERGLARRAQAELPYVGVDEKSFLRGHRYATVVTDIVEGRVLYVAEERKQSSLDGFWTSLSPNQLASVQGVAMDMWPAYFASTTQHVPNAPEKIVFDKFHIAKHLGEAVDQVRRRENKQLVTQGDDRLVGTKHDWLRNPDNFTRRDWTDFKELRDSNLKTARAWALKEQAMALWDYRYAGSMKKHFDWWYGWATRSRLKPMIAKAKMLKNHLANIMTYAKHPITNAISESLNSKIQWVKYMARGFRNFDNFRTAIYFHCGKLDLKPGH